MALRSVAEIEADIVIARAGMAKVVGRGQQEGHDGASVGRASLKDLREWLAELNTELRYASGGGGLSTTPTIGTGT